MIVKESTQNKKRKESEYNGKKTGLGKGLDALFSDKPLTQAEEEKKIKKRVKN